MIMYKGRARASMSYHRHATREDFADPAGRIKLLTASDACNLNLCQR